MREIILDVETTGLDPKSGHRMVEIGCIEMVHKLRTGSHFHHYVNPLRDMPAEAQAIHGISGEFLLDKPVFADIAAELAKFIGEDGVIVAHNASFDMKFINYELKSHGYAAVADMRVVDTLALARGKFPGAPANLDALCRRFDIDLSRRDKHGALLDAELLAEVYVELCGGKQVGINFAEAESDDEGTASHISDYERLPRRHHTASQEELNAHQSLIATLDQAIWNEYEPAA